MHAGALPGGGNVGAGEPAAQDVDGFHRAPVDLGDVAQVRCVRVVVGQHLGGGRVHFAVPHHLTAEHLLHSHIQTTS